MSDPLATRALTVSIDSALALALCDATLTVIDAPALRSLAPWTALAFASGGVIATCVFPLSLIVCALPRAPRAVERSLAALASGAAVVLAVKLQAALVLAVALVVLARCFAAQPRRAGWGRLTGAAFCALMAVATLVASHATRVALIEHSRLAALALRPLAARHPWPAVAAPRDDADRSIVPVVEQRLDAAPPLTLLFALDAIAPRSAIAMRSAQLIARNGAALIDARGATEGRGALDR